MTQWVNDLRRSPRWSRSLVVLVPDHWGCYPEGLDDHLKRHHIPLVMTGGALAAQDRGRTIDVVTAQTDLAATLLGILGVKGGESLKHSRDIFATDGRRHFAYFSEPEWTAILSDDGLSEVPVNHPADAAGPHPQWVKAYTQMMYQDYKER